MAFADKLRVNAMTRILLTMLATGLVVGVAFFLVRYYSGHFQRWDTSAFAAVGVGVGVAIQIVNYLTVRQTLLKPLKAFASAATRVAAGDLRTTIPARGRDEIGQVAEALNHMVASLTSILRQTQQVGNSISELTSGIYATTQENEVTATQQSSSVNEAATTVEELNASARQMTENARRVQEQVEAMGEHTSALSGKAQQIAKITTVVEDITQRINILALNVSIEAAKTSGAGGGFGVIAQEIRSLADRSSRTLEGISTSIEDIQNATNTTVLAAEEALDSVKAITLAITQQGVATNQIGMAMADISEGMSQTAQGTKDTVGAVERLNRIVDDLKSQVGAFKLE